MVDDMVLALNEMDAGGEAPAAAGANPSAAQRRALERVREAAVAMGAPPGDLTAEVALEELQVGCAYDSEEPTTRVPLDVSR
eukprot:6521999-Lingulodinium_polyedra.AAC.1